MRLAIVSSAWSCPMTRSLQRVGQVEHGLDLVLDHPADRDAGPVADDRGHGLVVDAGQDQRASRPAARRASSCSSCSSSSSSLALDVARRRGFRVGLAVSTLAVSASASAAFSRSLSVPSTLPIWPRSLPRTSRIWSTSSFSAFQRSSSSASRSLLGVQLLAASRLALGGVDADGALAVDDLQLRVSSASIRLRAVVDLGRDGVLADRHAGAGRVQQADRLVRQLPRRDVAVRQPDRAPRAPRRGPAPGGASPASRPCRASSGWPSPRSGSSTWTTWKRRVSAGSFSMCFLYSAQVVAATVRSVPRARAGLSRLAASPVPAGAAGADQRVGLVDEQDDRLGRGLDLLDHLLEPVLELALHAGAGLQQAEVQRCAASRPSAAAARRPRRCAGRSPRPPRSCPRRPRR